MNLKIHRGAKQIGGSCIELEHNGFILLLDLGLPLDFSGVDPSVVLPEIECLKSGVDEKIPNCAILISHPHQDHYGLVTELHPSIPVFASKASIKLIETGRFLSGHSVLQNVNPFSPFDSFSIGPFRIHPYLVDHSAFDSCSFLIEAGGKRVFYSGDFRSHGRKGKLFRSFLKNPPEKIDALLMEGTMMGRSDETVASEGDLEEDFLNEMHETDSLVMVTCSSQNIDRIVSIYRAALRANRTLVLDLFTALALDEIKEFAQIPNLRSSFKNLKIWYPYYLSKRIAEMSGPDNLYKFKQWKVSRDEISQNPGDYVLLIKPSYRSDLAKLNFTGGTYIYSQWKGYFKDAKQKKFNEEVNAKRMKIVHIHTSGHAVLKDLKLLVDALEPQKLIPVHTEYPDRYLELSASAHILSDGVPFEV